MPIVELEDGRKLEFPEGTSDEEIGQAVDEFIASESAQPNVPAPASQAAPQPQLSLANPAAAAVDPTASLGVAGGGGSPPPSSAGGDPAAVEPPVEDPGFLDYLSAGTGFGFGQRLGDLGRATITGQPIPEEDVARYKRQEAAAKNLVPYATAAVGGALGAGVKGASFLGRALFAGLGSGTGDAVGQAGTTGEVDLEQTGYAAAGGAVGQAGGEAAGKLLSAAYSSVGSKLFKARTDKVYTAQAKLLEKAGVPLTKGQKLNHEAVKNAEETLSATPWASELAKAFDDQATRLQSALMKKAGFKAKDVRVGKVTPEAITRAQKKFSKQYDEILGGKTVDLVKDDTFARKLVDVENKHLERLPSQQKSQVRAAIGDLDDLLAEGAIDGTRYQHIRSILAARGRAAQRTDPMTADLWNDLAGALDDAFTRNVDEVTGKAHKKLQGEYKNFKLFQKASERSGSAVSGGDIGVGLVLGAGKKGTKDFEKLARAGQSVLGTKIGRSGTAERLLATGGVNPMGSTVLNNAILTKGVPLGQKLGLGQSLPGLEQGLASAGRNTGIVAGSGIGGYEKPDFEPNQSSIYDRYR